MKRSFAYAALVAGAVSLVPSTASAESTIDTVKLRGGGMHRGRVTEIVPSDHVTIVVIDGSALRVPWGDIDRVIVANTPAGSALPPPTPAAGTSTPAAAPEPESSPMVGPRARVHLTSSSPSILYRRAAGTAGWVQACVSPCDEDLPIGDQYHVVGNNIPQSGDFTLQASEGASVNLSVDPASTAGMAFGGTLIALGGFVGSIAALVVLGSLDSSYKKDTRNTGLLTLAVSSVAVLGGILIFVTSSKTGVARASTSPPPKARAARDAFLREPTWRTPERGTEPTSTYPILFSHAF